MKISIIVPAFNEEKLLPAALQSIQAASQSLLKLGWTTELIVCDNNSTDHTAQLACAEGARVVFEPINQIARARNTGARAADGDWLLFVDADSHPSAELLADMAAQIQSGRCLAGGSYLRLEGNYRLGQRGTHLWNLISRATRFMAGSFLFCERGAFEQVGGFSEELFASEEIDLSRKLKNLAHQRRQEIVILQQHPLLTSARKLHLYTLREHVSFLVKTLLSGKRNLRRRESCSNWYDGRR